MCCCISHCICLWSLLLATFWVAWMFCLHQNDQCMSQSLLCPSASLLKHGYSLCTLWSQFLFSSIFSSKKQFPLIFVLLSCCVPCFYGHSFEFCLNYYNCSKSRIDWFYSTLSISHSPNVIFLLLIHKGNLNKTNSFWVEWTPCTRVFPFKWDSCLIH